MSSDISRAGTVWAAGPAGRLDERAREWVRRRRWLMLLVVAPSLLVALYMYLLGANQYVSESRFVVRSQGAQAPSILGAVLGSGATPSSEEAHAVVSFLHSTDAVRALGRDVDLVGVWRRNGLDVFAGVKAHPSQEDLTRYYEKRVTAVLNGSTGIVTLTVRAFRPQDAKLISEKLLGYSEDLVNRFSTRAEEDALRVSQAEVARTEGQVAALGQRITQFRNQGQSLDPNRSALVVTEVVGNLEGQLARARAELAAQRSYLTQGSPRLQEQETRVAALQSQLAAQQSRLTGQGSLAPAVAGYERLNVERDLANRAYASALNSLEAARVDAQKQHSYLVRVVEPNLPEKSTYPQRALTVLGVLGALFLAYGIGWLIIVGVREHAA